MLPGSTRDSGWNSGKAERATLRLSVVVQQTLELIAQLLDREIKLLSNLRWPIALVEHLQSHLRPPNSGRKAAHNRFGQVSPLELNSGLATAANRLRSEYFCLAKLHKIVIEQLPSFARELRANDPPAAVT